MKSYYKQCKDAKQVNSFLRRCGLGDFEFDPDYTFTEELDWDGWINPQETRGVSIQVTPGFEVFIAKYTRKDIETLDKELMQ